MDFVSLGLERPSELRAFVIYDTEGRPRLMAKEEQEVVRAAIAAAARPGESYATAIKLMDDCERGSRCRRRRGQCEVRQGTRGGDQTVRRGICRNWEMGCLRSSASSVDNQYRSPMADLLGSMQHFSLAAAPGHVSVAEECGAGHSRHFWRVTSASLLLYTSYT